MTDLFGIGKKLGNKWIKLFVNTVAATLWGIITPNQDDMSIHPPEARIDLIDLEEALRMGNREEFMKQIKFWEQILDLDRVRVAYAITTCLEAMKSGSADAVRNACLNLLGSSFFK